jgi:hypothetical protein
MIKDNNAPFGTKHPTVIRVAKNKMKQFLILRMLDSLRIGDLLI